MCRVLRAVVPLDSLGRLACHAEASLIDVRKKSMPILPILPIPMFMCGVVRAAVSLWTCSHHHHW